MRPNNGLELTSAKQGGGAGGAGTDRSAVLGRVKGQARFAAPSAPLTRSARGAWLYASCGLRARPRGAGARSSTRCWADLQSQGARLGVRRTDAPMVFTQRPGGSAHRGALLRACVHAAVPCVQAVPWRRAAVPTQRQKRPTGVFPVPSATKSQGSVGSAGRVGPAWWKQRGDVVGRAGLTEVGLPPAFRTASTCGVEGVTIPLHPCATGCPTTGWS